MKSIERIVQQIEASELLDRVADKLETVLKPLVSPPVVKDILTGRWLGHSVHPVLVSVPIGCWTAAAVLDVTGSPQAARRLTGLGVLAAVPTSLTGAGEWVDTAGAERRVGAAHALLNDLAVASFAASWFTRRSQRGKWAGRALSGLGLGAMGAAGYLGGHLAYVRGVAVNTTAFQSGPEEFCRLEGAETVGRDEIAQADLDGLSLLVARRGDDVHVLEDRCTHRGAPLSDGALVDDCIECPWHGSRFDLRDGSVRRGPASVPQPVYETREHDGGIDVRRKESGGLRRNPVDASHESDGPQN